MGSLRRQIHEEETPSEKQDANESADKSQVHFADMMMMTQPRVEEKVIKIVSPKSTVSSIPSAEPEASGEHEEMKMEEMNTEELKMGTMILRPSAVATPEIIDGVASSQKAMHQAHAPAAADIPEIIDENASPAPTTVFAQMIMHQTLSPAAAAAELVNASPAPTATASQMGMHQTLSPAAAAAELVDASPAASQMGMHQTLSPAAAAAELVDTSPAPSAAASQMGMHQTLSPAAAAVELVDASPAPSAAASQMGMHQTLSPAAAAAELIDARPAPSAAASPMGMHPTLSPEAATPKLIDEQTTTASTPAPSEMKSEQNEASTTLPPSGAPTVTPTDATPPPSATPTVTPTVATPPPSLAPTISTPGPSAAPSANPLHDKTSHKDAPRPKDHNQEPHSWTSGSTTSRYTCSNTSGFIQHFTCESAQGVQSHPIGFSLAFVVLFLLGCCTCRRACKRSRRDEDLGEYRAVADQYDEVLFEDTFDDNYSFSDGNESGGSENMSDDGDEDDWTKGPNIELGGVRHREKDELTLEEMNG